MSIDPLAPVRQRISTWRVARLTDRIERIEDWMSRMPISAEGPSYGELAEQVRGLRRQIEQSIQETACEQFRRGFRPSIHSTVI